MRLWRALTAASSCWRNALAGLMALTSAQCWRDYTTGSSDQAGRTTSPTRIRPSVRIWARSPPRWRRPLISRGRAVRPSRYWHGSQRRVHAHRADLERAVHEVIERNTGGRDVAPGLGRRELDTQALTGGVDNAVLERLDRLHLDQCDLAAAGARTRRVVAGAERVAVTVEPAARKRADFRERDHRCRRRRRDVDRKHAALPHGAKYIRYDPAP